MGKDENKPLFKISLEMDKEGNRKIDFEAPDEVSNAIQMGLSRMISRFGNEAINMIRKKLENLPKNKKDNKNE